jgi:hypothetical protein
MLSSGLLTSPPLQPLPIRLMSAYWTAIHESTNLDSWHCFIYPPLYSWLFLDSITSSAGADKAFDKLLMRFKIDCGTHLQRTFFLSCVGCNTGPRPGDRDVVEVLRSLEKNFHTLHTTNWNWKMSKLPSLHSQATTIGWSSSCEESFNYLSTSKHKSEYDCSLIY